MKRLIFMAGCGLAPWFAACASDDPNDSGDAGKGGSAGTSAGQSTGSGGSAGSPAGSGGTSTSTGSGGSAGSPTGSGGTSTSTSTSTSTGSGGSGMGGSDVGGAAGSSGGEAGSGGDARWAACPTADEFEDQASWPDTLEVTEGAVFCATFDENRTLKEEFAKKALLRIAPGSYRLPAAEQAGLALPVCIALGAEGVGVAAVPRSTSHQANPFDGNVSHRYDFVSEQPDPARRVSVSLHLTLARGTGARLRARR